MKLSYTTINHIARKKLKLSMHEYAVADVIYHLSNNPKSEHPGWCYASKETIAEILDLDRRSVTRIITTLLNKKLLQRAPMTKSLKTTSYWYDNVIIGYWDKMSHHGTKSPSTVGQNVPPNHARQWDKMSHYNNIDNNINNESLKKIEEKKKEIRAKLRMPKMDKFMS